MERCVLEEEQQDRSELFYTSSGPVDRLDARLMQQGGFTTSLSYPDRLKLRSIVRKVHLRHYPGHLIDDYECDRVIEAIGPQTTEYLIKKHIEGARE